MIYFNYFITILQKNQVRKLQTFCFSSLHIKHYISLQQLYFIAIIVLNLNIDLKSKKQQMSQNSNNNNKNESNKANGKEKHKGDKQIGLNKLSSQQLLQIQTQRIKEFFSKQIQKSNHSINIEPVNEIMADNILQGYINVAQHSKKVQTLLKPLQEPTVKITQKQMQMYEKQAKRIEYQKLISNLNKQLANKQPQEVIPYIFTKQQHQTKIREIVQDRKRREKKIEQIKKIMKQKDEEKQKQQIQKTKLEKSNQKQRRRIQIEEKITKQKQDHIHFLSQQIKHRKDYEQIVTKVPLHIKMENNFKDTIEMPGLQQKKRSYKELRDFKQRYSIDSIKKHTEQYENKVNLKLQQSKLSKLSNSVAEQFKFKFPQKSQRLKGILAQQILKNKMRWTQKDTYIQQKLKREENFLNKIKQNYKPKVDLEKKKELQFRIAKETSHLAKIGLQIDQRKVGLSYLGQVKQLVKKKKPQSQASLSQLKKYNSETFLPMKKSLSQYSNGERSDNNFLQRIRQKKLSKILNSQQENESKFQKLKIESEKLENVKEMKYGFLRHNFNEKISKEASNLAFNSIKAKMGLIQLMKSH